MRRISRWTLAFVGLLSASACKPQVKAPDVRPDSVAAAPPAPVLGAPTDTTPVLEDRSLALRGVWQRIPEFASGWTAAYQFFSDGRFVFHSSEMDCQTRLASYSGRWSVADTLMSLVADTQTTREGGHMEEAMGSCGSDSSLEGATEETRPVTTPRTTTVYFQRPALVGGRYHSMDLQIDTLVVAPAIRMVLGKDTLYKMREDPEAYP